MNPGDLVALPDGRELVVWHVAGEYVWVEMTYCPVQVRAVDVVLRRAVLGEQLALPLVWEGEA